MLAGSGASFEVSSHRSQEFNYKRHHCAHSNKRAPATPLSGSCVLVGVLLFRVSPISSGGDRSCIYHCPMLHSFCASRLRRHFLNAVCDAVHVFLRPDISCQYSTASPVPMLELLMWQVRYAVVKLGVSFQNTIRLFAVPARDGSKTGEKYRYAAKRPRPSSLRVIAPMQTKYALAKAVVPCNFSTAYHSCRDTNRPEKHSHAGRPNHVLLTTVV